MNVPTQNRITGESAVKIAASIEERVREGALAPGERLPTVRALARQLGVSPTTVSTAYRQLQLRGVALAEGRRGTRVSPRPPLVLHGRAAAPQGTREVGDGNPDPVLLPRLGPALATLDPDPLLYGGDINLEELLRLARDQFRVDGVPAERVAVVGGALDGIERVLREHLRPGDRVAVEDPGFAGLFDLLRGLGLVPVPVALDDSGLLPDALAHALDAGAVAVVVTPTAQNPTGAAFDARRVRELTRVLRAYPEALVVEDDHAGPVAGVPALTLCGDAPPRWAVIRSVSKSLGPDLRLAVLAGDERTVAGVEGRQILGIRWVSQILQRVVAHLWQDAATNKLMRRAAAAYAERREALLVALAEHGIEAHGRSGLNVWVPVAEEGRVVQAMLGAGWLVDPGERFRLQSPPAIRITVATLQPDEAAKLAADLARCLAPAGRGAVA